MKRLGFITLMAAALILGMSLPDSAEAGWSGDKWHQGSNWRHGGDYGYHNYQKQGDHKPSYHKQGYYGQGHQGRGQHKADWAHSKKWHQGRGHNASSNWCPYR